jgi:ElaB/YqjD/DUF883 family membrane-anchored ribosome-binding protein
MATTPNSPANGGTPNTSTQPGSLGGESDMGLQAGAALATGTATPLMSESTQGGAGSEAASNRRAEARSRFSAALEEARAGLDALRADAAERGANYRAMATGSTSEWMDDVRAVGGSARKKAEDLAGQGKTRASDGLSALGKIFSETATVIDERLGAKYGDYARGAARSMQETAARLEAKEVAEISDDVRTFVRSSPGTALGIAAVTGFFLARLFGAGSSKD